MVGIEKGAIEMKDNGGYVYPRRLPGIMLPPDEAVKCLDDHSGKTLRDDYAGQIAVGLIIKSPYYKIDINKPKEMEAIQRRYQTIARSAYFIANALIEEKRRTE